MNLLPLKPGLGVEAHIALAAIQYDFVAARSTRSRHQFVNYPVGRSFCISVDSASTRLDALSGTEPLQWVQSGSYCRMSAAGQSLQRPLLQPGATMLLSWFDVGILV